MEIDRRARRLYSIPWKWSYGVAGIAPGWGVDAGRDSRRPEPEARVLDMGLRTFVYLVWALAGLALAGSPVAAHEKSAIKAIRAVYKVCRAVARTVKPGKAFAVYTDENYNKPPRWVRRAPAKAMVVEDLAVYRRGKRIRAAKLMRTSPSGDWAQYFDYCYRADGTLAFVLADLRTFLGDVRVVDRLYYGTNGRRLRKTRRIFDLKTNKRITGKRDFQEMDPLIPKTTRALLRHARPAFGR